MNSLFRSSEIGSDFYTFFKILSIFMGFYEFLEFRKRKMILWHKLILLIRKFRTSKIEEKRKKKNNPV